MNFKSIPSEFEYLSWPEVKNISKDTRSTIIWPFGAVEQHGPHLPLATDSIFIDEIICEVLKFISTDLPIKKLPTQYIGFSFAPLTHAFQTCSINLDVYACNQC